MRRLIACAVALLCLAGARVATAQARPDKIDRNVVYGMYSGLALLMDVHRPATPNGYGVLFVAGNAWQSPQSYGAPALKDGQVSDWAPSLLAAGYTVFSINHRAAPRFPYPAPVEDVQRAVRFIRHHAREYGIDASKLGATGGSSGGHLLGLVAALGAPGIADDSDAVNREPATLQCVVLRAGPADLRKMIGSNPIATAAVVSFLGRMPTPFADDQKVYRAASPISNVTSAAPPTLLIHGDADDTVPYEQSVAMEAALRAANAPVKLLRVVGGAHGSDFGTGGKPHAQFPEVLAETVRWFDQHLRSAR